MSVLLEVNHLTTQLQAREGRVTPVDHVNLTLHRGRTLALVGESGSGKSLLCASMVGLLPPNAKVSGGQVRFNGQDILLATPREMQKLRGAQIGMVLQDAMTSLNPLLTIGEQIGEVFRYRLGIRDRAERRRRSIAALEAVGITAAADRLSNYPFEFSGGMRQRVCIAIALASSPALLICDEPTTALDVTVQLQILHLLRDLQRERGMSLLFVTHDIELAHHFADEVAVMYAGRIVERGPIAQVFSQPLHPYTRSLLHASPRLTATPQRLASIPGAPTPLHELGPGCRFAPRCAEASADCLGRYPDWFTYRSASGEHATACWHVPAKLAHLPSNDPGAAAFQDAGSTTELATAL